jgi:uncharacterized membrane protein
MERAAPTFDAVIHPYRSLGAEGFRVLFFIVVALNIAGACVAVWIGAWPVMGFFGLDVLAVYVAFRLSYRQARAFERITVDGEALIVERVSAQGERREWRFPSYWVSVWFEESEGKHGTVTLRSHGRSLEIAGFLSPFEREPFANALRDALYRAKTSPAVP